MEKMPSPTDLLCRGFPSKFGIFFEFHRALHFDDSPDYSYLRTLSLDMAVDDKEGVDPRPADRK